MQYRNIALALEVVVGYLLSLSLLSPTLAQTERCQPSLEGKITCASVDDVENSIMLYSLAHKEIREPVQRGTLLFPGEVLHTLSDSWAETQFNDGSIVRSAPETNFTFHPNRLNIQLVDGEILVMVKPGSGGSEVQTAVATVKTPGTTFLISHRAGRKETLVKVLTSCPVTVTSKKGQIVTLTAGQSIDVTSEEIASIQNFDLQEFYKNERLGAGLGQRQAAMPTQKSPEVQKTLKAIRQETVAAITAQRSLTPVPSCGVPALW